jgi:hypothetical protein
MSVGQRALLGTLGVKLDDIRQSSEDSANANREPRQPPRAIRKPMSAPQPVDVHQRAVVGHVPVPQPTSLYQPKPSAAPANTPSTSLHLMNSIKDPMRMRAHQR